MKNILKVTLGCIVLINTIGCLDLDEDSSFLDCSTPKVSTLSGTVIDNYTSLPIQNANIEFANFSFSAEESRQSINSDSKGHFTFTDSGCSFEDYLFQIRSVTHKDYNGSARTSNEGSVNVKMFKTRNFNLIFNNSNFEADDEINFIHHFCIYANSTTCSMTIAHGNFYSNGIDTLAVQVAEGETLNLSYDLNDEPRVELVIPTEGLNQFVITI